MKRNAHVREIDAPAGRVGELLDALGGPSDTLWPSPWWPPMVLDRPLRVGSGGGHGRIRYHVTRYEPGRLLEITPDPGQGMDGICEFVVEPLGPDRCRLRTEARGRFTGAAVLAWPLLLRHTHDAVHEDLLDRAEIVAGRPPVRPNRWSPWVRLVRRAGERVRPREVGVPGGGLLDGALDRVDAADAYAVALPPGLPDDPQVWTDALFGDFPPAVSALLVLREALVGLVGIERGRGDEFDTRARTGDEVLLGADAGHLDFRCVVRREPERLVVATVVALHGARGRLYWSVVRRVHPRVLRAMLARSVRRVRDRTPAPGARTPAGRHVRVAGSARPVGSHVRAGGATRR